MVCNADEGEPGCFQDRVVLDHDPHAVIEGMIIAGLATGAEVGFIYLRYEYPHALAVLTQAIEEARSEGILSSRVLNSDVSFEIHIRRGGGAYICGEETGLIESLDLHLLLEGVPDGLLLVGCHAKHAPVHQGTEHGHVDGGVERLNVLLGARLG